MNHFYALRRALSLIAVLFGVIPFSLAATFTVTNTLATGAGSLDQAIQDANGTVGADLIVFNIPGAGPHIITPGFPGLPAITEQVTIDGYSQPGASAGTMATRVITIMINGAAAGFSNGLTVNANDVTISGLSIGAFLANGIDVADGVNNTWIWGNFIGMDFSGLAGAGNNGSGINLGGESGPGGSSTIIIGTNSDEVNDANEGNLISDNGQDGVLGWTVSNCIISGNFIGSDRTGTGTTFGNTRNGVLLTLGSIDNRIGTNGDGVNDDQELNGFIMNAGTGITIAAGSNFNIVAGNLIGVNLLGAAAGNGIGIEIINSSSNRIGIDVTHANYVAESNVITSSTGPGGHGINLRSENFLGINTDVNSGNIIAGNFIGTTPTNDVLGNAGNGINFTAADGVVNVDHIVGSNNDDNNDNLEGNVIAYNAFAGIAVGAVNTPDINGIAISRNSVHDNGGLGVDIIGNVGVTANDNGDGDAGTNELYNFPVITSNHGDGENLRVTGISRPNSIIEVYLADGSGEGATFLFRAQEGTTLNGITDDLAGTDSYNDPTYGMFTDNQFEFVVSLTAIAVTIPPGAQLVAIGTDPTVGNNNTSEFGPAVAILPVTLTGFKGQLVDGLVKLSWTTSRETNSSHFVVEKSIDGASYISIGKVNSGALSGQYSFVDKTALGKINYYRLRMVDADRNYSFSKVLIIRNDAQPVVFKLSPNPVSTYLNVSFKLDKEEVIKLSLYDQMGRLSKRYTLQGGKGINAFTISDLGNLSAGNYVVEILGETLSVKQQIIKK